MNWKRFSLKLTWYTGEWWSHASWAEVGEFFALVPHAGKYQSFGSCPQILWPGGVRVAVWDRTPLYFFLPCDTGKLLQEAIGFAYRFLLVPHVVNPCFWYQSARVGLCSGTHRHFACRGQRTTSLSALPSHLVWNTVSLSLFFFSIYQANSLMSFRGFISHLRSAGITDAFCPIRHYVDSGNLNTGSHTV